MSTDELALVVSLIAIIISAWSLWLRIKDRQSKIRVNAKVELIELDPDIGKPPERWLEVEVINQTLGQNLIVM